MPSHVGSLLEPVTGGEHQCQREKSDRPDPRDAAQLKRGQQADDGRLAGEIAIAHCEQDPCDQKIRSIPKTTAGRCCLGRWIACPQSVQWCMTTSDTAIARRESSWGARVITM